MDLGRPELISIVRNSSPHLLTFFSFLMKYGQFYTNQRLTSPSPYSTDTNNSFKFLLSFDKCLTLVTN